jgi:hypothetical protein
MSQYVETNTKSFVAGAAIKLYARVKLGADGKVTEAGLAEKDIGTALQQAFADGDRISVKLRSGAGTEKMIAAAAITRGAEVFTAAVGKVSVSAANAFRLGAALEAAAADGDIIEVLRNSHGDTAVP